MPRKKFFKRWDTLTTREQDVTAYVCLGHTNRQIAVILSISPDTVKFHLHNVLIKYEVKSRTQLQQLMEGLGFQSLGSPDIERLSFYSPTSASPVGLPGG